MEQLRIPSPETPETSETYALETATHQLKRSNAEDNIPFVGPPPVSHTWKARPKDPAMLARRNKEREAEERAEVEVLNAQAKKHDELGRKIAASLARLQGIGSDLQAAVGPVYSDTQTLQTTTQNADRMLDAITKMQSPLEGRAEEEKLIRDGPGQVGLQNYLACLRRVYDKFDQLSRSQLRANQDAARELDQLLVFGAKRLQEVFEDVLRGSSEKVEPLQFITRNRPFPTLDRANLGQLNEIQAYLSSPSRNDSNVTLQIYTDIRGQYLSTSLSNLASATLTTARRQNTEEIYRKGTCAIETYATGIQLGFSAEWTNICGVFRPADRGRLFETTTGKTLSELARTLRDLNSQVKANMTTDCFLAYDVLGVVNELAFEVDKVTGLLKQEIFGTVKPVRDTAKLSLNELLEDIHRRMSVMSFLPMDGRAVGLTAEIMTRLQAMMAYPAPLGSIMSSMGNGSWITPSTNNSSSSIPTLKSFDVNPNSSSLLANYVEDTVETLFRDLDSKSRAIHKQRHLTGVFLLNNCAVVDRMVRSSELASLFANQASRKLENWRKKGKDGYMGNWRELIPTLMDTQNTSGKKSGPGLRPPSGTDGTKDSAAFVKSLSSKDKDTIKEKFKNFNLQFEDLCAKHRQLASTMEREVRQMLLREIQVLVDPMYKRFWDRYHEIDKGKGKYVKYDPAGLTGQLAALA